MKQQSYIAMALSAAFVLTSGCGAQTSNDTAIAGLPAGGGGGDQALQTTLAEPAPAGALPLKVDTVATGLRSPWAISFLPENIILVTERDGEIRAIRDGVLDPDPIAGGPSVYAEGQGGLYDILPSQDFSQTGVIYIAFAAGDKDENALQVAVAEFDGISISGLRVIYEATPKKRGGYHFGGRMDWGSDGKLYITVGEGSRYKDKAQDMTSSFGAVIRLNADGSIPADNPDFGEGAAPGLYTKGHRNPQGLVYDSVRDILWSNEHGPRGGDEINKVVAGANYGWPAATYGIDYNGARISPFTRYEGAVQPVKYWTPSIAPSGMAVYRGDLFPEWQGDLLVGALAGAALHRVIMDGDSPIGEERYLIGKRIRDVRVGPDGAIYVATEKLGDERPAIFRITPAAP